MTDTERERIKSICEVANIKNIGELSDGFHTFNGLYEQRTILFAALVKAYKDRSWKSYRHEDGELCFGGGWFIVGIDTPEGSYTYHYENKYWEMFDCVDLPRGKHWDGHTEADAETRLMSLPTVQPGNTNGQGKENVAQKWILCSEKLPEKDAAIPDASDDQEAKADAGKLDLTLVPLQIIEDIAEVRMYGNKKYGDPDNWKTVDKERYVKALLRHTLAYLRDRKSEDKESRIRHYKHMACNMAFICEMEAWEDLENG